MTEQNHMHTSSFIT